MLYAEIKSTLYDVIASDDPPAFTDTDGARKFYAHLAHHLPGADGLDTDDIAEVNAHLETIGARLTRYIPNESVYLVWTSHAAETARACILAREYQTEQNAGA